MSEYIVDYTIQPRGGMSAFDVREEIVRCRDCKYSAPDGTVCWNERFTHYEQIGDSCEWGDVPMDTEPNGFCAWGERKMDA